jgi:hypothetical protein
MKKIGIVAVLFVALGLIGVGCGSSAAGANECSTLAAAYTKAAAGKMCSTTFSPAASALTTESANCPAGVNSAYVSCYSACISAITDCTTTSWATTLSTCTSKCPAI